MKRFFMIMAVLPFSVLAFPGEKEQAVSFGASYTGDFLGNTTGGTKKDFAYLGSATISLNLNTEKAGWWKGGELDVEGMNTHGGMPTEKFVGDFQCVDNIEAGNHTFLSSLRYRQTFKDKLSIAIGLQDLNAEYVVCDAAGDYVNSSFGINSVYGNFGTPMFPVTGLGIDLHWNISGQWNWQAAVYDGGILDFDENPYNIKWKLSKAKGYLTITEWQFLTKENCRRSGTYKLGASYHTGEKDAVIYANIVQNVRENDRHAINVFATAAYAFNTNSDDDKDFLADEYLYNNFHISAGINFDGVFSRQQKDKLGIAFSTSILKDADNETTQETAIEMTYKYQVHKNIFLQPDLQYILKPSGELDNAFVAMMRFGFEF